MFCVAVDPGFLPFHGNSPLAGAQSPLTAFAWIVNERIENTCEKEVSEEELPPPSLTDRGHVETWTKAPEASDFWMRDLSGLIAISYSLRAPSF